MVCSSTAPFLPYDASRPHQQEPSCSRRLRAPRWAVLSLAGVVQCVASRPLSALLGACRGAWGRHARSLAARGTPHAARTDTISGKSHQGMIPARPFSNHHLNQAPDASGSPGALDSLRPCTIARHGARCLPTRGGSASRRHARIKGTQRAHTRPCGSQARCETTPPP